MMTRKIMAVYLLSSSSLGFKVRICVDFKPLNESVMREIHPLPSVDSTLAQLADSKIFSKLDTNSGFWKVPLAKES